MRISSEIIESVKQIRKTLHDNPEHSGRETVTKQIIKKYIEDDTSLDVIDYQGGILAVYTGEEDADTIAFRADFDAVSLPDGNAKHLCGHDGHAAALLGVAKYIDMVKPDKNIVLVFQPAEETGEGAREMASFIDEYRVSEIYGCHNLPGYEFGKIYTSVDTFACASCGMSFHLSGRPAHAANPETGASPYKVVKDLLEAVRESQEDMCFEAGTFATVCGVDMGQKAFGTSAEKADVWLTVRSRTDNGLKRIKEYLEFICKKSCEADEIEYTLSIQDEFSATVNTRMGTEKIVEKCNARLLEEPMRWSEDFGQFLLTGNPCLEGAFFGIGAGNIADLHTKDYEYPDELLQHQIEAFVSIMR